MTEKIEWLPPLVLLEDYGGNWDRYLDALYKFFKEKLDKDQLKYTGLDITPNLIKEAHKKYPDKEFITADFTDWQPNKKYDVVLACGSLTYKLENHEEWLKNIIKKMFDTSNIAVGFNLLSGYDPGEENHHCLSSEKDTSLYYHARPEEIFSFCKTITPYVTLRHDYLLHDFTIYMYH